MLYYIKGHKIGLFQNYFQFLNNSIKSATSKTIISKTNKNIVLQFVSRVTLNSILVL